MDNKTLWQRISTYIKQELGIIERRIKDVESWSGAASNYASTEEYCRACLINLNEGDPAEWTQANCKLPVRGPGDSQDTFVRQAVYAAAQRFGQVDAPQEALDKAKRELLTAYDEMGEEAPESLQRAISMSSLYEQIYGLFEEMYMNGEDEYPLDVFMDDTEHYVITTSEGKLYRYPVLMTPDGVMLGERVLVEVQHTPATRTVIRETNGKFRWFSISATSVLNRSGEIDSRDLFDSFVEHAETTGEYPIRQFYHQGEKFRTGQADYLARDGNCYITSGVFDDTELAKREIKAREKNPDYWGESIGYIPTAPIELYEIQNGIRIPVYRTGVNVEISTLPEKEAANLFTVTNQKGVYRMLEGKKLEAFIELFDGNEDEAKKWLEQNPDATNREIEKAELVTRETETKEIEVDDELLNQIVSRVEVDTVPRRDYEEAIATFTQAFEEMNARLNGMDETIKKQRQLIEVLTVDFQERTKTRKADTKLVDTRVVYKPRQVEPDDEPKTAAEVIKARLPKHAY